MLSEQKKTHDKNMDVGVLCSEEKNEKFLKEFKQCSAYQYYVGKMAEFLCGSSYIDDNVAQNYIGESEDGLLRATELEKLADKIVMGKRIGMEPEEIDYASFIQNLIMSKLKKESDADTKESLGEFERELRSVLMFCRAKNINDKSNIHIDVQGESWILQYVCNAVIMILNIL